LAHVADVGLVGDADDQDLRARERLPGAVVERLRDQRAAVVRHRLVHLAGQLDELGREVVLAGLPGQVEGVDRQAVAAQPRSGAEGHEAVRLGGSPIRSHSMASSLTSAMLTERKMFSSSLVSSAASQELTSTSRSTQAAYSSR